MKNIKLGKLVFNYKSIQLIFMALCINLITIGIYAFFIEYINLILFFAMLYMPYLFLYKKMMKNIVELP